MGYLYAIDKEKKDSLNRHMNLLDEKLMYGTLYSIYKRALQKALQSKSKSLCLIGILKNFANDNSEPDSKSEESDEVHEILWLGQGMELPTVLMFVVKHQKNGIKCKNRDEIDDMIRNYLATPYYLCKIQTIRPRSSVPREDSTLPFPILPVIRSVDPTLEISVNASAQRKEANEITITEKKSSNSSRFTTLHQILSFDMIHIQK
ncbi:hypothetical protein C1645_812053 [Glomus cerebriforme]|uniref:Uncharacterized protein n=1 Tax=Glomus cerebriforme TaxID=658196 RepID=A0A397TPP8_9GLOM|nr:hypothetical protein C1645_812053 [Glomus cerebriforme]